MFDGGGNYDGSGGDTYINVGADGSWLGLGSTNDYTNDPPTYSDNPTSGSGGTNDNNYTNPVTNTIPNYLAGELGNEIFDMTEERATLLTIHRRLNMNIVETDFLKNNREAALQIESYLLSHTTTEETENARAHLALLINDTAYASANAQAGFPQIGTDAWVNVAWKRVIDEGIPGWGSLNAQEKALAKSNPREALNYRNASLDAIEEAKNLAIRRLGIEGSKMRNSTYGNDRDVINAFQHSYWNANLTTRIGKDRTKVWTDAHESSLPNDDDNNFATQMDFFNNEIGRNIGQVWRDNPQGLGLTLAQLVESWLNSG